MSSVQSPASMPATPPPSSASKLSKAHRPTKKVVLSLPSSLLSRFPSAQAPRKASRSKQLNLADTPEPSIKASDTGSPPDNASDANGTPAPQNGSDAGTNSSKRKGVPGPKPGTGMKRSTPALDENGVPKPRGKPGPKKKLKLDDGNAPKTPWTTVPTAATAKLGPKANTGAINAGLRALDRGGKPCRRWARKSGFNIKSFTGVIWDVQSWRAPTSHDSNFNGDGKSDSSSELAKHPENSSAPASEKSNSGGLGDMNGDISQTIGTDSSSTPPAPTSISGSISTPVSTTALATIAAAAT